MRRLDSGGWDSEGRYGKCELGSSTASDHFDGYGEKLFLARRLIALQRCRVKDEEFGFTEERDIKKVTE